MPAGQEAQSRQMGRKAMIFGEHNTAHFCLLPLLQLRVLWHKFNTSGIEIAFHSFLCEQKVPGNKESHGKLVGQKKELHFIVVVLFAWREMMIDVPMLKKKEKH